LIVLYTVIGEGRYIDKIVGLALLCNEKRGGTLKIHLCLDQMTLSSWLSKLDSVRELKSTDRLLQFITPQDSRWWSLIASHSSLKTQKKYICKFGEMIDIQFDRLLYFKHQLSCDYHLHS